VTFLHAYFRHLHESYPWLAGLALFVGWLAAFVILALLILPTSEATDLLNRLFSSQSTVAVGQPEPGQGGQVGRPRRSRVEVVPRSRPFKAQQVRSRRSKGPAISRGPRHQAVVRLNRNRRRLRPHHKAT
jgi:hypothetical protein